MNPVSPFHESDIKVEAYDPHPTGGQQVGCRRPVVKVTHLPTDNFVVVGTGRSARESRMLALSMLEWMCAEINYPVS